MSYTPISPFPTPPNRISDNPTEFSNKADAFLGQFPTFQVEANDLADWMDTTAATMQGYSDTAQAAAATATESANIAQSAANFKGEWSSLAGALNVPAAVYHNGQYWNLLNDLADVTASEPSVSADWVNAIVAEATFNSVTVTDLSVGEYSFAGDINGDFYLAINATWDGTGWNRVVESQPAWLYQHNIHNDFSGETFKAVTLFRAAPATNPIGSGVVGGWTLVEQASEDGSFYVGDNFSVSPSGVVTGNGSGLTNVNSLNVTYDNAASGLTADNVQDALDELKGLIPTDTLDLDVRTTVVAMTSARDGYVLTGAMPRSFVINSDLTLLKPLIVINATNVALTVELNVSTRTLNGVGTGKNPSFQVDSYGAVVITRITSQAYVATGARTNVT